MMTTPGFRSLTAEAIHYVKQFLSDGKVHTRQEIMTYLENNMPHYDGARQSLMSSAINDVFRDRSGEYMRLSRGLYQRKMVHEELVSYEVTDILRNTVCKLKKSKVSYHNLEEKDLEIARQISHLISVINDTIASIEAIKAAEL